MTYILKCYEAKYAEDIVNYGEPDYIWDNGDGAPIYFWFNAMEARGDGWYHKLFDVDGVLKSEGGMGNSPWNKTVQRGYFNWKFPNEVPKGVCL